MDSAAPCLSFITVVDFSQEPTWKYVSESVSELLGFEPHDLVGRPYMELIHPDEYTQVEQLNRDTVRENKAACLAYLRLRHKNPYKGYILCAVTQTNVHNVIVGSISFASPGPKAMHNASTAQEVKIITPAARNFEFHRWNEPSPLPATPVSQVASSSSPLLSHSHMGSSNTGRHRSATESAYSSYTAGSARDTPARPGYPGSLPSTSAVHTGQPPRSTSTRTALILDRFSENCPVMYVTNDELLPSSRAIGRSFFDFVVRSDEAIVRSWIDAVKGWGVNERGQPSDGGFGYGKFTVCLHGRDSSSVRQQEPPPSRHRHTPLGIQTQLSHPNRPQSRSSATRPRISSRPASALGNRRGEGEIDVNAIFSAHSDGLIVILRVASN